VFGGRFFAAVAFLLALARAPALAGPPYQTDDPEPTPYRSFEIYLSAWYARTAQGR
jgi:hypothetical protein